jgi:hypothetical protein
VFVDVRDEQGPGPALPTELLVYFEFVSAGTTGRIPGIALACAF